MRIFLAFLYILPLLGCSQTAEPLSTSRLSTSRLPTFGSLPQALKYLSEEKIDGLFIYFYSSSCLPCRVFEQKVLNDETFKNSFSNIPIVKVQVDGTVNEMAQSIKFGIKQTPSFFVARARDIPVQIPLRSQKGCGIKCIDLTKLVYKIKHILRAEK